MEDYLLMEGGNGEGFAGGGGNGGGFAGGR